MCISSHFSTDHKQRETSKLAEVSYVVSLGCWGRLVIYNLDFFSQQLK